MRIEFPEYFLYGGLLFAGLYGLISRVSISVRARRHVRALAFAFLLSPVLFAGHGESVVVPVLAILAAKGQSNPVVIVVAAFFCALWWGVAFVVLARLSRKRHS
jgi:hypothetical protein